MPAAPAEGSIRRIDLGHCDSLSISAAGSGRWWAAMLYGGFDSAVNERANAMRWPKGRRRYDLAILAELARLKPRAISLTLDGQRLDLDVTLVAIGNGPQYGGGKRMAPDARMDDGIFDITVIGPVSRFKLARLAPTLPHAGHIGHREVSQYRAREVTFAAVNTMAYADGELLGPLPLTTRCVSRALPVLIPLGSMSPGLSMVQTSQNG